MDDLRCRELAEPPHPGFFGKVPTHGDFVSSGLSRAVQSSLDHWIDEGMSALQEEDEDWETRFRAMPSWRFVIQPPIWGDSIVAGILTPSRDRVGRSFPLVIAAPIAGFSGNPRSLCFDQSWFTAAEALGETTRFKDFDLTRFTDGLKRLRLPYPRQEEPETRRQSEPCAIWWTIDSEHQADGFMALGRLGGLDFVKLLAATEPVVTAPIPNSMDEPEPATVQEDPKPPVPEPVAVQLSFKRSYATHAGTRLANNADSLLVSNQPTLFAITDGIADDYAAKHAARLATSTLSETRVSQNIDDLVRDIKGKLGKASSLLLTAAASGSSQNGASVAALAFVGASAAVVWAGDTRCYLIRDGMMRCLTRDHLEIGMMRRLVRFVGAEQQFIPEVTNLAVQVNDRFVLCSSGLLQALGERTIANILLDETADGAADALIQEALISNARNNISAIVIDAHETE